MPDLTAPHLGERVGPNRNGRVYAGPPARTSRRDAMRQLEGQSILYAIRLGDLVKIGCTRDIANRISHLAGERGIATRAAEILAFRMGDFDDEVAVHHSLRKSVAEGREYYHPTAEVMAVVNEWRANLGRAPLDAAA